MEKVKTSRTELSRFKRSSIHGEPTRQKKPFSRSATLENLGLKQKLRRTIGERRKNEEIKRERATERGTTSEVRRPQKRRKRVGGTRRQKKQDPDFPYNSATAATEICVSLIIGDGCKNLPLGKCASARRRAMRTNHNGRRLPDKPASGWNCRRNKNTSCTETSSKTQ